MNEDSYEELRRKYRQKCIDFNTVQTQLFLLQNKIKEWTKEKK